MGNARKAKGAKLQLFGRFCALGNVWPHVLHIHGSLARAFARRVFSRPQGTGDRLPVCPGKQKPGVGLHPERTACVRGLNADTNTVRDLLGAAAHPEPAACVRGPNADTNTVRELPTAGAHPERTAGVRDAGKKKTRSATCPAQPRVRARRGEEKDTERDLPGAAARACETRGGKRHSARLAHRRCRSRA